MGRENSKRARNGPREVGTTAALRADALTDFGVWSLMFSGASLMRKSRQAIALPRLAAD